MMQNFEVIPNKVNAYRICTSYKYNNNNDDDDNNNNKYSEQDIYATGFKLNELHSELLSVNLPMPAVV
jgi:hypothetical protein